MNRFFRHFTYSGEPQKTTHELQHPAITVAFVGNPNCGKTTLFNALTGASLKTANWPGVTVEGKEGFYNFDGHLMSLIDLPGTYSLTSYTMEEEVTRSVVFSDEADVIVDVVDASCLERSLYLTLELLALKKPVVVALNMMDIVKKRGIEIDLHRLAETLGAPVIPISARKRQGLKPLMHAVYHHKMTGLDKVQHVHETDDGMPDKHEENVIVYSAELEKAIDAVQKRFEDHYPDAPNPRWYAIKELEGDKSILHNFPLAREDLEEVAELGSWEAESHNASTLESFAESELDTRSVCCCSQGRREESLQVSFEQRFITERYDFIQEIIHECVFNNHEVALRTDGADRILTNKWFAIPIFLCIMGFVFFLTFFIGDTCKEWFEAGLDFLNGLVGEELTVAGASAWAVSLICDGVISGVGTVLTFLPNIFILFLALAFLEDSGYMSRVAYVMDTIMSKLGLSGRAFIPMILGFGCTVPAVLATRTLESKRDKLRVMLVCSFMSCSARLPIYILLAGIFFTNCAALVAFGMYLLGIIVALLTLLILHVTDGKRSTRAEEEASLLIELPDYKMPDAHSIWMYMWDKVKDYLIRAGTVIFLASIAIWLLLHTGPLGYVEEEYASSFAGMIGHAVAPVLAPFGCGDWRFAVALLAGVSAKEVIVSSLSVLFGISGVAGPLTWHQAFAAISFGPANALGFLTFCLLYVPCIATLAVIASESKSSKFTVATIIFNLVVAWVIAVLVYVIALACLGS